MYHNVGKQKFRKLPTFTFSLQGRKVCPRPLQCTGGHNPQIQLSMFSVPLIPNQNMFLNSQKLGQIRQSNFAPIFSQWRSAAYWATDLWRLKLTGKIPKMQSLRILTRKSSRFSQSCGNVVERIPAFWSWQQWGWWWGGWRWRNFTFFVFSLREIKNNLNVSLVSFMRMWKVENMEITGLCHKWKVIWG